MPTQTSNYKMLANLQPGDRIKYSSSDLGVGGSKQIESTVSRVIRLTEGWHAVVTEEFGVLKAHAPTYKYAIV